MSKYEAVEKLKKTGKVTVRLVMFGIVLIISLFFLNACVESQTMPEPFDGEHVENTNPLIDPLVDKGEQFGGWINEKVDPNYEPKASDN